MRILNCLGMMCLLLETFHVSAQQNPIVLGNVQIGDVLYPNSFDGLDVSGTNSGSPGIVRLYPNGASGSSLEFYANYTSGSNLSRLRIDGNYTIANRYTFLSEHSGAGNSTAPIVFRMDTTDVLAITPNTNVGIGTTTPGSKLEVNGNVTLTSGSGASLTFADGTTQSTGWTGSLCGGDYAESMDVSGDRTKYEPGDVLMLDANSPGKVLKVSEPYSTLVAGIYSTKPGITGRRQTTDPKISTTEVPMAMVGVVPTKVSAENGPIKVGDLLVTSSTPGHAMKGTDRNLMFGAVVGKSMGNLDSGTGVIEVLVSLQ